MPLNERDRIEILMMIGVGDRMRTQQEVCRLFHEMHPDREPVSQSTVSRIERKYRELGHVRDAPRQGRPKINENVQQDVILSALENPHCTVRQVSRDLNIGKSSVSNIFKKVKYHPYRVRLIHELAEDDFDRRTEFCEYMMDHNNQNNGFIANILFSDEATFFLNGHVNRQNTRYWSQENPHWMQEYHTQHPQKVDFVSNCLFETCSSERADEMCSPLYPDNIEVFDHCIHNIPTNDLNTLPISVGYASTTVPSKIGNEENTRYSTKT
ncbi:hypothetical protein NQ318_000246 [Aromia moschata]|uniref:DUF4817 domain-containing protein n=1 Tax=Aromia moschata TaxID=1265417 RepID=A0AAV8YW95_9CUCU|nr:hypothetical protein NQ318_000246 [Aromia moschata]